MYIAAVSNLINVAGNITGVFILHAGVEGVAWSIVTTIGVRLVFSVLFAAVFRMGVIGIALAMCPDWCTRAVIFYARFKSGKWKQYQLI